MPDTPKPVETAEKSAPPKRSPGHRGQDVRDTVAEMVAKAQEISREAGSKMSLAMKEVIGAAAGLNAFSIESARDLIQFMVRRVQMTQEEGDKLLAEAEAAWLKKNKGKLPAPAAKVEAKPEPKAAPAAKKAAAPAAKKAAAPAAKKAAPAAKKPAPKK